MSQAERSISEEKVKARVEQLQHHMSFDAAMQIALRMEWEDDRRALLAECDELRQTLLALERSTTAHMLAVTSTETARTEQLVLEAIEFARAALERKP